MRRSAKLKKKTTEKSPKKRILEVSIDWDKSNSYLLVSSMKKTNKNYKCLWSKLVSSVFLVFDSDKWRLWGIGLPNRYSLDSLEKLSDDRKKIFLDINFLQDGVNKRLRSKEEIEEVLLNLLDGVESVINGTKLKLKRVEKGIEIYEGKNAFF